jgi:hypothetical protein
MDTENTT